MCSRCFELLESLDAGQRAKLRAFWEDDESNDEDLQAVSAATPDDGAAARLPGRNDASAAGDQTPPLPQEAAEKLDAMFGQQAMDLLRSMADASPAMPGRGRSASGPRQGG